MPNRSPPSPPPCRINDRTATTPTSNATPTSEHSSADSPAAAGKVGVLNQRDGGRPRVEFTVDIKGAQTHLVGSQWRPLSNGKNDAVDAIPGHGVTVETVVVHCGPLWAADQCRRRG